MSEKPQVKISPSGKKPARIMVGRPPVTMAGRCRHFPHVSLPCNYSREGFCSIDVKRCRVTGVHRETKHRRGKHGKKRKVR